MYHLNTKNSSPYHNHQSSQSPEQQNNEIDLDKYLNVHPKQQYTDKLKKQIILADIQSLNSQISNICKQRFGDLTIIMTTNNENYWAQIQKTIRLVKSLTSMIYRDGDIKKQLNIKIRKCQDQIARQTNLNQKLLKDKRTLQKQKQSLDLKLKSFQRQYKQDMQKIRKQRDEAQKKFQQISSKQNQYKNQSRKNQQIISQLQQKIKNKITDKKVQIKNRFEVIQQIKTYGTTMILSNGQNEFNQFFVQNFQNNHKTLIQQNQYLKKCLQNVYMQLHQLLQVKKEIIKKRKGFESALDSQAFQLQNVRPESFNLPKQYSDQAILKLGQNLSKFKQAIRINELVNDKVKQQKVQCINNVKNLLGNYKQIVQNQDKLINRVVLKSKQFKSNQMANIDSKYGRALEQDDLQKSKKFLEQQREILLERNKELQMTRKAMKNTIKKAQQQKKMFNKKKAQTNQQLMALKKNIEKLPAMVEQQLSSMM